MGWLIDGHNLIPFLPGLSLATVDDEMRLIELLQVYRRMKRKEVEVYFDGAPPGKSGTRRFGLVKAHFVRFGKTADDAIITRLRQLGNSARNVTVVSSDRRVRIEAASLRVPVISSDAFARDLVETVQAAEGELGEDDSRATNVEVEEWLRLFGQKPQKG